MANKKVELDLKAQITDKVALLRNQLDDYQELLVTANEAMVKQLNALITNGNQVLTQLNDIENNELGKLKILNFMIKTLNSSIMKLPELETEAKALFKRSTKRNDFDHVMASVMSMLSKGAGLVLIIGFGAVGLAGAMLCQMVPFSPQVTAALLGIVLTGAVLMVVGGLLGYGADKAKNYFTKKVEIAEIMKEDVEGSVSANLNKFYENRTKYVPLSTEEAEVKSKSIDENSSILGSQL